MRTILAKILLWSLGTFTLSLIVYGAIGRALERRGPPQGDPFWSMAALIEEDACHAFEQGGPGRLAAHLARLDRRLPGEHLLLDAAGRDLVRGDDRSALLASPSGAHRGEGGRGLPHGHAPPAFLPDGRVALVGRLIDGRYRFVTVTRPWFGPPNILPYFVASVLVIAVMATALAIHLAAPLRRLRSVVERFGQGELSARDGSSRRDEIGELARAFDEMAGRIETLLAAERRLLQDISHELRSPLARLGFAIELARTSADRDAAIDRIRRDLERLNQLVGSLLALTHAEGDPQAMRREPAHLHDLVREVADDCALEATSRSCRIETGLAPIEVLGDREVVRRAVENVLRNAVRHAPAGSAIDVRLTLSAGSAFLTIRDRGPGVPDVMLESIFDPFVRVEGDRSRSSGGVGLGLSIAKRAVCVHGGSIDARNAGPGLIVTITLPNARPAELPRPGGGGPHA